MTKGNKGEKMDKITSISIPLSVISNRLHIKKVDFALSLAVMLSKQYLAL